MAVLLSAGAMACGCSGGREAVSGTDIAPVAPRSSVPAGIMPKGVAYRMSGDYADNVPITLSASEEIASYPAPSDVWDGARPIPLADGWWLDRRGVGERSVFTRYTYTEYAALKSAPARSDLLASVIAGARVTEVMQLPVTTSEALADTAAVNAYIRTHCRAM